MVLLRRLTRQALSHRSKRRLFAAPALDMRIIEHRSDPLKDAPGRFRACEPDRRESISDHHARNLIDRRRAVGGNDMGFERCQPGVSMPLVCLNPLACLLVGAHRALEVRWLGEWLVCTGGMWWSPTQ